VTLEEEVRVEATGETVGEAKWAALRELEKRHPGLDKAAVRFQVVSEGERGLLGVGYAPAKVVAAVSSTPPPAPRVDESVLAADVRKLIERIVDTIGVQARVYLEEDEQAVVVTCEGPELGMLIGRHGQTIDAVQYLLNAVVFHRYGEGRKEVVVDAAGYRARRRASLEALAVRSAQRALRTGEPVELDPMTAVERKTVHLRLKDFGGVETASEGSEPHRFVVISPT
jgi:spoIIIJ-associated protein